MCTAFSAELLSLLSADQPICLICYKLPAKG
jgi:hypothetical protein